MCTLHQDLIGSLELNMSMDLKAFNLYLCFFSVDTTSFALFFLRTCLSDVLTRVSLKKLNYTMQLWKSPHRMLQSHQDSGRRLNVDNKKMQGEGILSYNNQATS
jgi:hypothetical protein